MLVSSSRPPADGYGVMDVPLAAELAGEREDLHAVVFAVGDDDGVVAEHGDAVGQAELARVGARLPPRLHERPVRLEAVDARVAVPVGNEDLAVGGVDGHVGRAVERLPGLGRRRLSAEPEELLAVAVGLRDGVSEDIDQPEVVLVVGADGVGAEPAVAGPRLDDVPVGVLNGLGARPR